MHFLLLVQDETGPGRLRVGAGAHLQVLVVDGVHWVRRMAGVRELLQLVASRYVSVLVFPPVENGV